MTIWPAGRLALPIAALALLGACGPQGGGGTSFEWFGRERPRTYTGQGPLRVRWTERIAPEHGGAYSPVQRAVPALDPTRDRIYVGSTAGHLYAMGPTGARLYRYDAGGAIESQPAIDRVANELYLGTEQGTVHALDAEGGRVRWRERVGGPIRQVPLLTPDVVYVVTDADEVAALAREDGGSLWTYSRPAPEGFSVTQHAGLTMADGKLLTAFTDGVVVALDPGTGEVLWERDTSIEVESDESGRPRFVDVDTTPVVLGTRVYIASFAGGLYALDLQSGTVLWRDQTRTGVVAIVATETLLVLASADDGIVALDHEHEELWRSRLERGGPTEPVVIGRHLLVGESAGGFLALSLDTGREVGRFESGHGFSAHAAVHSGVGFVVSNGGTLFAFTY